MRRRAILDLIILVEVKAYGQGGYFVYDGGLKIFTMSGKGI